jgi:uncharacterized protein (DUF1786 family)
MNEHEIESETVYRYREGAHGAHCVDLYRCEWTRLVTIGRAATKDDALELVKALNFASGPLEYRGSR